MSRRSRVLLAFLVISSLLLAAVIAGDWLPWLRGPAPETPEWYWPYQLRPLARWWLPTLSALLIWGVAAWWLKIEEPTRRQNISALTGLALTSLLLQLAVIYADRPDISAELVDRTLSNLASGFFEPAAEIEDLGAALSRYPQLMPEFISEHARTHPPGLISANWLTIQLFSRFPALAEPIARWVWPLRCTDLWLLNRPPAVAAALGIWSVLPLVAAALSCFPAYGTARQLLTGQAIRLATILAATLPALLLFAPKSVQLYAPLALLLFWIFQTGLNKRSLVWILAAGGLLSLLTFLSLGNASLLLLFGTYILAGNFLLSRRNKRENIAWAWLFKLLLVFAAGSFALWLVVWIAWGVNPWTIAHTGLQQHYQLVTNIRRYEWWIIWNLIDLILFAGWPLLLGFAGGVLAVLRSWRKQTWQAVDILALSLLMMVILLNLSGSARGEVGRLWLFFMPLLAFPSARFWLRALPGARSAVVIVALQLLMIVVLGLAWRPVRAVIVVAEPPAMLDVSPTDQLDLHFQDETFSLAGFNLAAKQLRPGDNLAVTLFWQAQTPARRPYTVFNHLLDNEGNLITQQDNWPVNGSWPPTCWRDYGVIVDSYALTLPQDIPAGQYKLITGMYDARTGARLPLVDGRDAVELQTIRVNVD
ncbi:MAG: hypothetical protein R3293_17550 [Candidatus Promineifilaceae bacterium]|nr:hypothetical protein [Candidatus Promineifilaceae bacterium]